MAELQPKPVIEQDLKDLKERMKMITDADPSQYHNEFSLKRYLRAFKTTDAAFQQVLKTNKWRVEYGVAELNEEHSIVKKHFLLQQVLKTKKWRVEYGVAELNEEHSIVKKHFLLQQVLKTNKWRVEYGVTELNEEHSIVKKHFLLQQVLKTNKWRVEYGVTELNEEHSIVKKHFLLQQVLKTNKWRVEYGVAELNEEHPIVKKHFLLQQVLKTNKWRVEYGVAELNEEHPIVKKHFLAKKARVLKHRDMQGRPVIYIPARHHNANDRDIDELTKFIVYCLEEACKKCFEEVVDNLCIVFDLKDFGLSCMDYQVVKNLIWLLSRHYPERLGVCLIINSPALFTGCWAVIKGWLDENTAGKVTFVSSEEELCQYLIPDILPDDI